VQADPRWYSGSATIDERFVVKFAWSEPAAQRLWHEIRILDALGPERVSLRIPRVHFYSDNPVLLVTELVEGEPLTYEGATRRGSHQLERTANKLARFLSRLHEPGVLAMLEDAQEPIPAPVPQATTDEIRQGIAPWIRTDQFETVLGWCDQIDRVQAISGARVLVHGDFHGHNQVWDLDENVLRVVVDFDQTGMNEPEFDFRYIPAQWPGVDFLLTAAARYHAFSGRELDIARVMAWHTRTVLGDALWRSRAGVSLPFGGTPEVWVDELRQRLFALENVVGWNLA
jgi:aminoglycoside phosphotransferase (APT) family kinase protein